MKLNKFFKEIREYILYTYRLELKTHRLDKDLNLYALDDENDEEYCIAAIMNFVQIRNEARKLSIIYYPLKNEFVLVREDIIGKEFDLAEKSFYSGKYLNICLKENNGKLDFYLKRNKFKELPKTYLEAVKRLDAFFITSEVLEWQKQALRKWKKLKAVSMKAEAGFLYEFVDFANKKKQIIVGFDCQLISNESEFLILNYSQKVPVGDKFYYFDGNGFRKNEYLNLREVMVIFESLRKKYALARFYEKPLPRCVNMITIPGIDCAIYELYWIVGELNNHYVLIHGSNGVEVLREKKYLIGISYKPKKDDPLLVKAR